MNVIARNLTLLLATVLLFAGAGCTAPQSSTGAIATDSSQAPVAGDAAAKRFQNTPPGGRTAVESAIELSQKYASLSDQTVTLREENQRLKTENENLQQQIVSLETRLKQTQKELSEANDLLIEMLSELNTWKSNILGFRGEMRDAAKAQLEALLKVLEILGGKVEADALGKMHRGMLNAESNTAPEPNSLSVPPTGDVNDAQQ
jgi:septal ring factor EnvC (AmiA/AmiB activator)